MTRDGSVLVFPVSGPPGAGKTTALTRITLRSSDIARFGVRDYGMELARSGHPLGREVEETLRRGELLTNDQVLRQFRHFLEQLPGTVGSVAVEGYPRDTRQCRDLLDALPDFDCRLGSFVVIDIPDEVAHERVQGRRICRECGHSAESREDLVCGKCGARTAVRLDDSSDRLVRRLVEYRTQSREVHEYFTERGLMVRIDGLRRPEDVHDALTDLFRVG